MVTLESSTLPKGPLYDPQSKIKNFVHGEDYNVITLNAFRDRMLYTEPTPLPDIGPDMEWRRPKDICDYPYFINRIPNRFDALQGKLGDCWLVVAMEGLTFNYELINHVVPADQGFDFRYSGAFHFRIWQLGTWYDVVVDDRLPVYKKNKKLVYAHSKSGNVFWAALLEKAYCKMCGKNESGYAALDVGRPSTAFQDFTGGLTEVINPKEPRPGRPLKWFLNELVMKRSIAGCLIIEEPENELTNRGIHAFHAHLISSVYYTQDDDPRYHGLCLVRILNPWGHKEWGGEWSDWNFGKWTTIHKDTREGIDFKIADDGEFWMSVDDLAKFFSVIYVCHLGPGQYLDCHSGSKITSWKTTTFHGEWVRNVSAGGRLDHNMHLNPQFKVSLTSPNDSKEDGLGPITVVIELTQRSLLSRKLDIHVGFSVYYLPTLKEQQDHLDKEFFKNNIPKNDLDLRMGDGGSYVDSLKLFPGWYCIVPFTAKKGEETSFLLRIFTECDVDQWVYDKKISKSPDILPLEDARMIFKYDELKDIFDEASENEEVDWIGLKYILETGVSRGGNVEARKCASVFKILTKTPRDNEYKGYTVFSKDECRSMIAMLDHDNTGKLNYYEFCNLWKKIHFWHKVYDNFRDSEGYLKVGKLRDALSSIGFNLNNQVLHRLVHFYVNEHGKICSTHFIICGVVLETYFTRYGKDKKRKEGLNFTLEEWVKNTLAV